MEIISATDIGIKRKENQDNYWCARLDVAGREVGVVCVCDGMGGLNDGGLASRTVVQAVKEFFTRSIDANTLVGVIKDSNKVIYEQGAKAGKRMGTTCTILICDSSNYTILHIGDSRCYLIEGDDVRVLTTDHSALNQYKVSKEKNPEMYKKYRSALTRCIGVKPDVEVDVIEGEYQNGDIFLLCSDGFWHFFDSRGKVDDLDDLKSIIGECIENGETDNITVGVLKV